VISVGAVGLGWWGRVIAGKIRDQTGMRLVATADADPGMGATVSGLDELLQLRELDAVILCIPHAAHAEAVVRCAIAGKHVFCEKPLALTAASARRAVMACATAGVVLGVGHERRFEAPMRRLMDTVRAGELGTILYAEAAFNHDRFANLPADHWRGSIDEAPAAGMTGMGVHLTDALISMLGPVEEVRAYTARRVLPLPTGDVVSVQLRFHHGPIAAVSAVSATPFYGRMAVFGSEGWIELRDDDHPEAMAGGELTTCRCGSPPETTHVAYEGDAVLANLMAWAAAIDGGATYPFSPDELVHNVAVLEATTRSAATGSTVPLVGELAWG
jgi:predicted dehydrogenase